MARITRDAAVPRRPTLRFIDKSGNVLTDFRFGIWERLSGLADTEMVLPSDLIDTDDNRFLVQMLDPGGSVKESKPQVSVCFARAQSIVGTLTAELTKKSAGQFESQPLMLVTSEEDLHDPGGMHHALAARMLEAHLGGEIYASYSGVLSPRLVVGPTTRSYSVHIFAVTQHPQAPSGSIDPWFGPKQAAARAQHARALPIYERLCMRLKALPYAGIAAADLVTTVPLSDGTPLHVVRAPPIINTNAMNETIMAELAAKYPAQNGIARVFVVGTFNLRGEAFPPRQT